MRRRVPSSWKVGNKIIGSCRPGFWIKMAIFWVSDDVCESFIIKMKIIIERVHLVVFPIKLGLLCSS